MTKKIIVVDDSSTIRRLVKMALSRGDFEVIEAKDGVDALEKLAQHRDAAMMICDLNMPRMNGLELVEAVRGTAAYLWLPLMMLTTEGHGELLARAKKAGVNAWTVKPFKPEALLAAVAKLLGPSVIRR